MSTNVQTSRLPEGDMAFSGLNMRDDVPLQPGEYVLGENTRCQDRLPETRKGVIKPLWAHRTDDSDRCLPFTTPYGAGVFRDPNGRNWIFVAGAGGIYRITPNNAPRPVTLPTGVSISAPCTFEQAFNQLYCFRGRDFPTLVLDDTSLGFRDVVAYWDAAVDYALGDRVAWGPWQTPGAGAVTSSGGVVTVVLTSHGFVTGQDITVRGATETEYNGRVNVTVVDEGTFTYAFGGSATSPATGTIKVSNQRAFWQADVDPAVADEPGVSGNWTQVYDVLPNADNGLYINNRLLVPTAYSPGSLAYDSTSSYTKKDYLIATDYQDAVRFDFANEFRINQGSADEIVDVLKFTDDVVLVFKDGSWYALSNVAFNLSTLSLDQRGEEYGLASRGARVLAGTDAIFLAGRRGVVSVRQTELGKIQGVDLPLSYPIEKWINRIAWPIARDTARMAYWNNRLYVAVPLDDGSSDQTVAAPAPAVFDVAGLAFYEGLTPGRSYQWTRGANAGQIESGGEVLSGEDGTFVPEFSAAVVSGSPSVAMTGSLTYDGSLAGVNNTVLVYDFTTSKWVGRDTGPAQCVLEYFLFPYQGVDRLFYLDALGYINLVEGSDNGCDQVGGTGADGFGWEPIAYRWRSRWLANTMGAMKQPTTGSLVLQTWNPHYDMDVIFQGVNKLTARVMDVEKDRTRYYRPWDRPAYDVSNVNDDHGEPEREDYSVDISDGVLLGENGVLLDAFQETSEGFNVAGRAGRRFCLEVRNSQGRIRVLGFACEETEGRARKGSQE